MEVNFFSDVLFKSCCSSAFVQASDHRYRVFEFSVEVQTEFFGGPHTTYQHGPEPIIECTVVEVDAVVDRATDLWVFWIEPPTFVILGCNVSGNGLALADDKVPLLKHRMREGKMATEFL